MQKESRFKTIVLKRLREIPDLFVVKIQQAAIRGTPDLLICYKGNFIAWELKTEYGMVNPLQEYTLTKIKEAGGSAWIVRPSNLEECLKSLLSSVSPLRLSQGSSLAYSQPLHHLEDK